MQFLFARLGFVSWMTFAYGCVLALAMVVVDDYMWLRGPMFFVAVTGAFGLVVVAILNMRGEV